MERANAQNTGSVAGQKGRGQFDPEDFLGLAPAAPVRTQSRDLPPIVTPPVYQRGQNGRMVKVEAAPAAAGPSRAEALLARELARAEAAPGAAARVAPRAATAPIVTPPSYDRRGRRIVADQPGWSGVLSRSGGNPLDEAPLVDVFTDPLVVIDEIRAFDLPSGMPPSAPEPEGPTDLVAPPVYTRRTDPAAQARPAVQLRIDFEPEPEPVLPSLRHRQAPTLPISSRRETAPVAAAEPVRAPMPTLPITSRRERPVFDAPYLDLPDADQQPDDAPMAPEAQAPLATEPQRGSIREPMALRHAGIEYPALGWTTEGVTLESPLDLSPRGGQGQGFDVTLLIGAGRTRIEMCAHVRAVDARQPGTRDYAFVGLDRTQEALLAQIAAQAGITGPSSMPRFFTDPIPTTSMPEASPLAAQLAAMIRAPEPAVAPASDPAPKAANAPKAPKSAKPRRRRLPLRVGPVLFGLTCAAAGLAIWAHASTIDARYAAVSVATTTLAVPAPGFVTSIEGRPGQSVAEGSILGHILSDASGPARAILSPCTCTLDSLSVHEGDFVTRDQAFATFSDPASVRIHALVSLTQAGELDPGDRATIRLIDGTEIGADLGRIGRVADFPGYTGLDAQVFAADRYARVELVTDAPVTLTAGTEARVSIQSSGFIGALQVELVALTARLRAAIGV